MKLEQFLIAEEGDDSRRLPDGRVAATFDSIGHVWNIGPGLTKGVTKDTVWTPDELAAAEAKEFAETKAAVARLINVKIGENQRCALESLTYNIGIQGFAQSTVRRRVNACNFAMVPDAFRMWNKAHGVVINGLVKRREDEIRLWLHPDDVPPPPDLRTSANVPPASFFAAPKTLLSQEETQPMATASVVPANPSAGVNVPTATVVNTLIGNLSSALIMIGAPVFAAMQGSTTAHYVAGALGFVAGLGSLVTNTWNFISHNNAASSNTLATISNLTNLAAQAASALEPASVTPIAAAAS